MDRTPDTIQLIWNQQVGQTKSWNTDVIQPCLEVIDVSPVKNVFKVKLTDGRLWCNALINGTFAQQLQNGDLKLHCLLKLHQSTVQEIAKKSGKTAKSLFITEGACLPQLPQDKRADPYTLGEYPERSGNTQSSQMPLAIVPACEEMTQAAQIGVPSGQQIVGIAPNLPSVGVAPVGQQALLAPQPLSYDSAPWQPPQHDTTHTTPERRPGVLVAATHTPSPPQFTAPPAQALVKNTTPYGQDAFGRSPALAPGQMPQQMPQQQMPQQQMQQAGAGSTVGQTFGHMQFGHGAQASVGAPAAVAAPAPAMSSMPPSAPVFAPAGQSSAAETIMARSAPAAAARPSAGGLLSYMQPRSAVASAPSATIAPARAAAPAPAPWNAGGTRSAAVKAPGLLTPISQLTPYIGGRWQIKARVTTKEAIRKFTNARGEGQLFKIELKDSAGSEMSATFFGRAVDKYFEMIRPNQVYFFQRGSVKAANRRFDRGDFVISFDENTVVEVADEDQSIPGVSYNFQKLEDVHRMGKDEAVDVRGIIIDAKEPFMLTIRSTGKERPKRELCLWDSAAEGGSMALTIWGDQAHEEFKLGTVMYARGARISEWNESKTLNFSGHYDLNPDDQQAFALLAAYDAAGRPQGNPKFGGGGGGVGRARETLEECREADLQLGAQAFPGQSAQASSTFRHSVMATLACISAERVPYYMSCPELVERAPRAGTQATQGGSEQRRPCNKKSNQDTPGMWTCAAGHQCNQPVARFMLQKIQVLDHSGAMEVSLFDDAGRRIFGCAADELVPLWEDLSREAERDELLKRVAWKRVVLRLRSAKDTFRDEEQIKVTAEEASAVDFAKEGKRLLSEVLAAVGA